MFTGYKSKKPIQQKKFFFVELRLKGVGFRSLIVKKKIFFRLGLSHYFSMSIPSEIFLKVKKDKIIIFGNILQSVTTFATSIYGLRKPDAYKSKGVTYASKIIKTKVGKQRLKKKFKNIKKK